MGKLYQMKNYEHAMLRQHLSNQSPSCGFAEGADVFGGSLVDLAEFPVLLEVEPEARRRAEGFGEHQCHLRGNATAATADFVDARDISVEMSGESHLRNVPLVEHFLENISGVNGDWKIGSEFGHV